MDPGSRLVASRRRPVVHAFWLQHHESVNTQPGENNSCEYGLNDAYDGVLYSLHRERGSPTRQ